MKNLIKGPRGQRVDKNDSNLPKRKPRVSSSTQNVKSTVNHSKTTQKTSTTIKTIKNDENNTKTLENHNA